MSKLLAFNWKMNPATKEGVSILLDSIKTGLSRNSEADILVCPPYIFLDRVSTSNGFLIGSQDVSNQDSGALTGEISANMIKEFGCQYVIIGHSETRELRKLTNQDIQNKVRQVLLNDLVPILCIGYAEQEFDGDINFDELKEQILVGLNGVGELQNDQEIYIAYEPVWAIGSGKSASSAIILQVNEFIKKVLQETPGLKADKVKILYGGSVSDGNIEKLSKIENVDGFLVGGASLIPEKVTKMIELLV